MFSFCKGAKDTFVENVLADKKSRCILLLPASEVEKQRLRQIKLEIIRQAEKARD